MFYKQFLPIIDALNPDFVEKFDYWIATLPTNNQKNITASLVSSRMQVSYTQAEAILKYAEKQRILEKYYLVKCPDCDYNLSIITKDEIAEILTAPQYCDECNEDKVITPDDVYTAYKVILQPEVTQEEIARAIEEKLYQGGGTDLNFTNADSILNDTATLYEAFYNPSESAYQKFAQLRDKLDLDYGKNTTAKGKALENLIVEIFNNIKCIRATNKIRTRTNQFDCTAICGYKTGYLSIFSYLAPYFIIECKNEPKEKPNNTYCNKLLSIMDTNEAQFGIVFGRVDATSTCFDIAREHYIRNSGLRKQQIIITCSDDDLVYIIDKRVNLLEYLQYKILQVTSNSITATFEMLEKKK